MMFKMPKNRAKYVWRKDFLPYKVFVPKSKQKLIEKVAKPGDIDGCLFVDVALNVGLAHI